MIDTIILRLHDLEAHHKICNYIQNIETGVTSKDVYTFDARYDADALNQNPLHIRGNLIHYIESDNLFPIVKVRDFNIPSSSYSVSVRISRGFIEINVSLPKLMNGNNISQFVADFRSKNFTFYANSTLEHNIKTSYKIFTKYLYKRLFQTIFPNMEVHHDLIEIRRIDFCYNQFFQNKEQAIEYFKAQKKIKRKRTVLDGKNEHSVGYSRKWSFGGGAFKIYHKGSEYKANDAKRHERINKKLGKQRFDVERLQKVADRILRYEVTYYPRKFSYYYNKHIFRTNCPTHRLYMSAFTKYSNMKRRNEALTKKQLNHIRVMNKLTKKIYSFFPFLSDGNAIDYHAFTPEKPTNPYYNAPYTKKLHDTLLNDFFSHIKSFQITEKPSLNAMTMKLEAYNKRIRKLRPALLDIYGSTGVAIPKGFNPNLMKTIFILLETKSWHEIEAMNVFAKSTLARYKSHLKKMDIDVNAVYENFNINTTLDFKDYHYLISSSPSLLF